MVTADERSAHESQIRTLTESGDKKGAATLLLQVYGREILGFLIARLRDRETASEVFSTFCEDLWRGLDGFRWQCTVRVWSYALARNAASRYVQTARKQRARNVPLSHAGPLSEIVERVRTATLASARTEAKGRVAVLRQGLPPDDQTLLTLRIHRGLTWREIAMVMLHEGETVEDAVLTKEAVRLRQRYQAAKARLRKMAEAEGLISKKSPAEE